MSNTYFVKERVNHDGIQYERGQEILLTEAHAEKLLASGVVSESPVEEAVASEVVAPAPEDTKASLDGGGEASTETGEPSLDGNENKAGSEGTELHGEGTHPAVPVVEANTAGTGTGDVAPSTEVNTGTAPVSTESTTAPQNDPSVGL